MIRYHTESRGRVLITFFCPQQEFAADVCETLRDSLFELVRVTSWDEAHNIMSAWSACVVGMGGSARPGLLTDLKRFLLRRPHQRILLIAHSILRDDASFPDDLPSNVEICFLPQDGDRLPKLLGRVWVDSRVDAMRARVRNNLKLPFAFRIFLLTALKNRLTSDDGTWWTMGRRVEALCQFAGITRSQVYRQAAAFDQSPRGLVDAWAAVQLLVVRGVEGLTWIEVEQRAGFASFSGVSDLIARGVGHRPSTLPTQDPEYWLRWFDDCVLSPLLTRALESRSERA